MKVVQGTTTGVSRMSLRGGRTMSCLGGQVRLLLLLLLLPPALVSSQTPPFVFWGSWFRQPVHPTLFLPGRCCEASRLASWAY